MVKHQLGSSNQKYPSPIIDHWVLQLHGVAEEHINDPANLQTLLERAVKSLSLTKVSSHSHYFDPGVSLVIILSESHLSAHTWPELKYLHIDLVSCIRKLDETGLEKVFKNLFQPEYIKLAQLTY